MGGSTARRDLLLKLQEAAQAKWEDAKVFQVDAPQEGGNKADKFFGNFPYPYMNGLLHLGHAFSLSKLEFAAAYHRLCGKQVLFPQAFHTTGMPIKACADKLAREISTYGNPPQFPADEEEEEPAIDEAPHLGAEMKDPTKFGGKKSKAAAKKGAGNTQWDILKMSGIPQEEIPQFAESAHWLRYFPPLAKRDLTAMGCGIDWRRSFVTTDINPYYDSFIRWQFWNLYSQGKIVKDKRYAVYSPLDGQPCADHDRASGEGVGPQEYTLIKMRVLKLRGPLAQLEGQGDVFLVAATLRPETMYGQTNAWALPEGEGLNNEIYVMAARSALNLSYQDRTPETGKPHKLLTVKGQDLIGLPVKASRCGAGGRVFEDREVLPGRRMDFVAQSVSSPHTPHERIYVLPLLTILMNKGTGIVTSVPSDAPDDYAALMDLKNKPKLREKFGVKDEWVLPFEVIPIIEIPGFGTTSAVKVCEDMKITSQVSHGQAPAKTVACQNDTKKLAEAKQAVYLKGFTDGVMLVGPYAGRKVSEVKAVIKEEMIGAGEALLYSEPEKTVMSRSGDECVVALTDQWYITYGEQEWREATQACLDRMEVYDETTRNSFVHTLGWLNQWACSRSFGLGTRLPWDPVYLIESLSDSTIYMAYYAVAHLLQQGDMYGEAAEPVVKPEQLTKEVWDYIYLGGEEPAGSGIPNELLARMRLEFEYWYPFDLRVSGKDLIQNHLTFCLYNHTAIWSQRPDLWPLAMRTNGHLLLNAEKMSKSTGNFKTLEQAIREYSSDAMRVALADAGDAMDDANFEHTTANGAILRLTKELTWIEETLAAADSLRDEEPSSFLDRVFDNEMNIAVAATRQAYDRLLFREALKSGCYDLQNARDSYRFACGPEGMNRRLLLRYIEVACRLLAPICPHTCEHIWGELLRRPGLVVNAGWPQAPAPDFVLQRAANYIDNTISNLRKAIAKAEAPPKAKKGQQVETPPKVTRGEILVIDRFGGWQAVVLNLLADLINPADNSFPGDAMAQVLSGISTDPSVSGLNPKAVKQTVMPFAKYKLEEATKGGPRVLDVKLPFDEAALLENNIDYLRRALRVQDLAVRRVSYEEQQASTDQQVTAATPGAPAALFSG
ncbi:hypothetical protein N2152v2_009922 [Parachlorella kessleri]